MRNNNIYKVSQSANDGYNTYDSFIVVAESEDEAKDTSPTGEAINWNNIPQNIYDCDWAQKREDVKVLFVGLAKEGLPKGIILASFNP